mmetsp:Transcript_1210/g.2636  ORF Transcript_1210/g.2636 Transcript_1210/m.2636 type:complete len:165 (-) Transcript_1210:126-620(-)
MMESSRVQKALSPRQRKLFKKNSQSTVRKSSTGQSIQSSKFESDWGCNMKKKESKKKERGQTILPLSLLLTSENLPHSIGKESCAVGDKMRLKIGPLGTELRRHTTSTILHSTYTYTHTYPHPPTRKNTHTNIGREPFRPSQSHNPPRPSCSVLHNKKRKRQKK